MPSKEEFLHQIAEDLEYVNSWDETINEETLSRGSATLRKLLANGELQKAWKLVGFDKSPKVPCYTMDFLGSTSHQQTIFAHAGGVTINEHVMSGSVLGTELEGSISVQTERMLPLPEFIESCCLIFQAVAISRKTLIKAVANRMGVPS
jgi:hypothetical protein